MHQIIYFLCKVVKFLVSYDRVFFVMLYSVSIGEFVPEKKLIINRWEEKWITRNWISTKFPRMLEIHMDLLLNYSSKIQKKITTTFWLKIFIRLIEQKHDNLSKLYWRVLQIFQSVKFFLQDQKIKMAAIKILLTILSWIPYVKFLELESKFDWKLLLEIKWRQQ